LPTSVVSVGWGGRSRGDPTEKPTDSRASRRGVFFVAPARRVSRSFPRPHLALLRCRRRRWSDPGRNRTRGHQRQDRTTSRSALRHDRTRRRCQLRPARGIRPIRPRTRAGTTAQRPKQRWPKRDHGGEPVSQRCSEPGAHRKDLQAASPGPARGPTVVGLSHETTNQAIFMQTRVSRVAPLPQDMQRVPCGARRPRGRSAPANSTIRSVPWSTSPHTPEAEDRAVPGHWEGDLIIGHRSVRRPQPSWSAGPVRDAHHDRHKRPQSTSPIESLQRHPPRDQDTGTPHPIHDRDRRPGVLLCAALPEAATRTGTVSCANPC
jgi:hypothetical protein